MRAGVGGAVGALLAALALAACGGAPAQHQAQSSSASSAAAVAATPGLDCVAGQAATGATGTAPQEPDAGVNSVGGACWTKIAGTPITANVIRTAPAGTSASWKAAWSKTTKDLYIWTDVHTGRKLINSNQQNPWEDDTVEIYLGGADDHSGAYGPNTGQLVVNSIGLTDLTLGSDHTNLPTVGATAHETQSATGYTILLIMPLSNLKAAPASGTKMAFSVGVDYPGTGATSRAGQTMWQGTSTNWNNDSAWGTLVLG